MLFVDFISRWVRSWATLALAVVLCAAPGALAQLGGVQVEIHSPAAGEVVPNARALTLVEGRASVLGGIRKLDLFLVMDTSKSLRKSDPDDYRSAGAVGLVRSLFWSNTYIGVVDFDRNARLASPLSGDRTAVMEAIQGLDQKGTTNLADGIRTALQGFEESGRPGSTRIMLVFTDGKSKQRAARKAMEKAREQGVSVSTLLLGSDLEGESILREIADGTGGSFVAVRDPAALPDAFLGLRATGVERVELRVNESSPIDAELLAGGAFRAEVPLSLGENRIVARAMSVDGREREHAVGVTLREAGCAELQVRAERAGQPSLSISNRAVEIVVDASGSMWGTMNGRTKIEIAKEILDGALDWLPPDLNLSLRAYGHQYDRKAQNCEDTELLVSPASGNRGEMRRAIDGLRPKGQTPLGYALEQISADFGGFGGERAVVLVTDGLESCDGDAPSAVHELQNGERGTVPVHVIGFGLAESAEEDLSSLRAIAAASGGKFLTAGSAAELRRALGTTVGTRYHVSRGDVPVAQGTLGADDPIRLPAGTYRVRLDSAPPQELSVELAGEESLTLVVRRDGPDVVRDEHRAPTAYAACGDGEAASFPAMPAPVDDPSPSDTDSGVRHSRE